MQFKRRAGSTKMLFPRNVIHVIIEMVMDGYVKPMTSRSFGARFPPVYMGGPARNCAMGKAPMLKSTACLQDSSGAVQFA